MESLLKRGSNAATGTRERVREMRLKQLRNLLTQLDRELHPSRTQDLDLTELSSLEKDLAIDSLARVELLFRLERDFEISITDQALTSAETVADLLDLILSSGNRQNSADRSFVPLPEATSIDILLPQKAQTLPEVLAWHYEQHPDRTHLLLYENDAEATPITYRELYEAAQGLARGLTAHGLMPGQNLAIMLPTGRDYLVSFFGILFAGAVPVPIYPPARISQLEDHLRRHALILQNARCQALITSKEIAPVAHLLKAQVTSLLQVFTTGELMEGEGPAVSLPARTQDLAFLQYTSGSTGTPKGVKLSHANLLANIRAMGQAVRVNADDLFVSWLPLYHDMGLIGAWLGSLYHACPLVLMSPLAFLARPHRWLWAIHRHRGTLSAAPNFAYELCLSKINDQDIEGLDLSSWRFAFNGAEPVSPNTIRRFQERFSQRGFRAEAMAPVYGLAESTVGLAFPSVGRSAPIDRIQREAFELQGSAVPASDEEEDVVEVVACGQPLPGHQIRVVDDQGRELPERRVGNLQFQGPSSTSGYFLNPEETQKIFKGDWIDSGDLAYIAGGDVYPTGRVKDVIIRAGRNIYPQELEEAVGNLEGIRKGCVAVFGSKDAKSGTERLVVLAETYSQEAEIQHKLRERVSAVTVDLIGSPADEVVLTPPYVVLKTSSGKVRRDGTRQRYEKGLIDARQRSVLSQFTRLALSSLKPQWQRLRRLVFEYAYAAYAWTLFGLMAPLTWLLVALLPLSAWRWKLIRGMARFTIKLAGLKLLTHGVEHLQEIQPAIIVSNHASYLDGLLLVAALPGRFHFIAKRELLAKPIPRIFLSRIGADFVERFNSRRAREDLDRLNQLAAKGGSLLFFPEGTFSRIPGLLPFRLGAFVAATQNDLPVVPVTIRGSRSLLRADSWFPRRVMITIIVSSPFKGQGKGWEAAIGLRDEVRDEMLKWAGEPDLAEATRISDKEVSN